MNAARKAAVMTFGTAALLAGSVSVAGPALAYPQNCSAHYSAGSNAYSYCAGGSGSHRVVDKCYVSGSVVNRYGPWVATGTRSYYYCNAVAGPTVQKQGD